MSIPHQCPHCESSVETDVTDIDGIESQRIECPSCEETLVAKRCPECTGDAADADAATAEDCEVCGGDEMVLERLEDLLS